MGALGPLVKVANGQRRWVLSATIYTLSGVASAAIVGALIGSVGNLLLTDRHTLAFVFVGTAGVAVLAADAGIIGRVLLRPRWRQTSDIWPRRFPLGVVAAMWGFDLGLAFNARLAFAGPWLLAAVSAASGSAEVGALLFVSFWLGRALPVWASPHLLNDANDACRLNSQIGSQFRVFKAVELSAVVVLVSIALVRTV